MYIRLKKRRNPSGKRYSYAYLVRSKGYRVRTPKQRVVKYLGRVFDEVRPKGAHAPVVAQEPEQTRSFQEEVLLMLSAEYSLRLNEVSPRVFETLGAERAIVDLNTVSVYVGGRSGRKQPACVILNEGFVCDRTLNELIFFKTPEALEREIGRFLAKKMIFAGLKPKKEEFIRLFKIVSSGNEGVHQR